MEKTEWNAKQVEISFVNTIQWSGWRSDIIYRVIKVR